MPAALEYRVRRDAPLKRVDGSRSVRFDDPVLFVADW